MVKRRTDRQETYAPLREKTLFNVLRHQFVTEFGYDNKVIFAEAMITRILQTIAAFVQPTALLKPGQLLWMAVAHDGQKHAHQPLQEIPQTPVILDLVTDDELRALADGQAFAEVRQQRLARLLRQAFAQGGVLAQNDLAAISLLHRTQVAQALQHVQETEHCLLPYRGTVQDIGATVTHKVEVIRLFEAGYLEPDICQRLSVPHDLAAVENYVQTYKNVLKLFERGFAPREVSGILAISEPLVNAYIAIIREHHPDSLARNPHFQEPAPPPN